MTDRSKRMAVRVADEDLAWLTEQADDEGVEPATLVRMIISRLRKGRQPLVSMMQAGAFAPVAMLPPISHAVLQPGDVHPVALDADEVLQSRLAELGTADVVSFDSDAEPAESAAIPLRRIGRNPYNPGRS